MCGSGTWEHFLWGLWIDGWLDLILGVFSNFKVSVIPWNDGCGVSPKSGNPAVVSFLNFWCFLSWQSNISWVFSQNNSKFPLWGGVLCVAVGQGWTFVCPFTFLGKQKAPNLWLSPKSPPGQHWGSEEPETSTYKSQSGFSTSQFPFHDFNPDKFLC